MGRGHSTKAAQFWPVFYSALPPTDSALEPRIYFCGERSKGLNPFLTVISYLLLSCVFFMGGMWEKGGWISWVGRKSVFSVAIVYIHFLSTWNTEFWKMWLIPWVSTVVSSGREVSVPFSLAKWAEIVEGTSEAVKRRG